MSREVEGGGSHPRVNGGNYVEAFFPSAAFADTVDRASGLSTVRPPGVSWT